MQPHSKPWIVALKSKEYNNKTGYYGRVTCAGTLITSRLVLTAAHCICHPTKNPRMNSELNCTRWRNCIAIVGEHDIKYTDDDEQALEIESAEVHKKWTGRLNSYFIKSI